MTPTGEIVAVPLRGAWTGNRGILHRGHEIVRFHAGILWITCVLQHKDWRLPQWQPGHFTVLFFHDEAVSLAAGHRPCALCRRQDYDAYRSAWRTGNGGPLPSADEMNRQLHNERIIRGSHQRRWHSSPWRALPPGSFVLQNGQPALVLTDAVAPWTKSGYAEPRPRPRNGTVDVITPPSTVAALSAGYPPQIDSGMLPLAR